MTWWPGGNARQRLGPQAREAQRLDHRLMGTTRAGTGPAPSQNEIIVTTVVVHGTGPTSGVFIYNGTPGLGNPPQIAMVPTGVTTDPYGNAITSSNILMQGNVITETGGIFRTAAAAPLIQLDGPHNTVLIYNAASGLADTIAPAAGSDGLGSAIIADIVTYTTSAPFLATQVSAASIQFWHASARGGPYSANGPQIQDQAGNLSLVSGTFAAAVQASLTLISGASQAATLVGVGGPFSLSNTAAPSNALTNNAAMPFAASGHLKTVSTSTGGDGNTYRTERIRQVTTATQTFTLASAVAITGLSFALGVGTYHAHVKVPFIPTGVIGSSHNLGLSFTGTATGNLNGQCSQSQAAAGAINMAFLNGGTLSSTVPSPTHVAQPGLIDLEADITVTVAGTLTPTITLGTAGDNIITSAGTFWEINPET